MERWEYDISVYPIKNEMNQNKGVIECDPEGICMRKDMPRASKDAFLKVLNERGAMGWELVEMDYNVATYEFACIWKRKIEHRGLEH
jgi:hypothetical protein